ncbi:DNA polymerase domain-containing protein [Spirochaeta dissipatitropha]
MDTTSSTGFIVHAWSSGNEVRLAGRLLTGQSFAATIDRSQQEPGGWETWTGEPGRQGPLNMSPVDRVLLSSGIRSLVRIEGGAARARRVDLYFRNPSLEPLDYVPGGQSALQLRWMAIDIETDRDNRVIAVSLVCTDKCLILYFGDIAGEVPNDPLIEFFVSESELLRRFSELIVNWDPDVITGWNVTDFDMTVLEQRFTAHGLPFDIGRSSQDRTEVRRAASGFVRVVVPGRQVVDAMRIVRGSGKRFEDMRLETVAQAVLGHGKSAGSGYAGDSSASDKMEELERLRGEDPVAFCMYCLKDSQLVLDILGETGLDALTEARSGLTGMSLDMAWTSIPVFERLYDQELMRRRIIPPATAAADAAFGAPGGTVLEPIPGLFCNVLVFDFRSLYPSIMRTFNIDPLSYERARQNPEAKALTAPNGARFVYEEGILRGLLDSYFAAREKSIENDDSVGAYVYKILMNSFYGVLGSEGCRYARRELAGAITGFGKVCLLFARDFFREAGYTVLYGDTDSVFVFAGGKSVSDSEAAELAAVLNSRLDEYIRQEFELESTIHLRFESAYSWLLLPKLRAGNTDERVRGRAKGYAGSSRDGKLEIRGIEAARSDYTRLARDFQTAILELLFSGADATQLVEYVRHTLTRLHNAELDDLLVYRKVLRRPAAEYTHAATPQVRAARKLGWTKQKGRIDYIMTLNGAEPLAMPHAEPDYRHYVRHQLEPIWRSIVETVDLGDSLLRISGESSCRHPAVGHLLDTDPFSDQLQLGF